MLRSLFSRAARTQKAALPSTEGVLIYAVGDIHGRLDLLTEIMGRVRADAEARAPSARPVLVFVGDYVDRGPDSAGVIDAVLELEREGRFDVRPLKGNHEAQMLEFLGDARAGAAWAEFGGAETLRSYGVTPPIGRSEAAWEDARIAFTKALPDAHRAFLERLELAVTCGDYLFVHAGVRPGVPLNEQSERDLLWIREDFIGSSRATEKVVVHGHTPEQSPHRGRNRIGIDTGAYATGTLTAVRLDGTQAEFLQTDTQSRLQWRGI